jgi:hypothetical protein
MQCRSLTLSCLGLYLIFLSLSPGWFLSHDASARLAIGRQLWQHHTLFLDTARPERFVTTPQGKTTYFGLGQSLVFIPFDRLGFWLGKIAGLTSEMSGFVQTLPLIFLYSPLVGILWWLALLVLQRSLGVRDETMATLFLLSTIALPYVAQSMQEEALLGALVALVYALFLSERREHRALAGFVAGICFLFRLNVLFAFLPLGGLFIDDKSKKFPWAFLAAALPPLALLGLTNMLRFGTPFSTGYDLAYAELAQSGIKTWQPIRPGVALALLFGPGKGLFLLSPALFLSLYGLYRKGREHPWFAGSVVLTFSLSALLYSKLWGYSCGGYAWGSRFHVHLISVLFIPFLWGWQSVTARRRTLLLTVSILVQVLACLAPESLEYVQERVSLGDYHERLVTGFLDGQLLLRVRNVWDWLTGVPLWMERFAPQMIGGYRQNYMPNLWGFSYARNLGHAGPLVVWALELLLGLQMTARHVTIPSLKQLLVPARRYLDQRS